MLPFGGISFSLGALWADTGIDGNSDGGNGGTESSRKHRHRVISVECPMSGPEAISTIPDHLHHSSESLAHESFIVGLVVGQWHKAA